MKKFVSYKFNRYSLVSNSFVFKYRVSKCDNLFSSGQMRAEEKEEGDF